MAGDSRAATRGTRRYPRPRALTPLLVALLIGACENGGGGAYPPSPGTSSSSPSAVPSTAAARSSLAAVAPALVDDPLVTRIHATGAEEEPLSPDAIDRR